jgi:asparagine synthase (glutamine-hydrolysing)
MTDPIQHRGPNDVGYLLFDNLEQVHIVGDDDTPQSVYDSSVSYTPNASIAQSNDIDFTVALGHRRLSIIDLSTYGHLPMSYNNGRYWITFNGEIYNYKQLKDELILLGHSFISKTDTEVILAAYIQWGASCLQKFNGMWAFSIYDCITKEIFLSRDRFGIKPLYYWVSPQQAFCFASEIKQFTFLPDWQAVLNGQRGYDYLVYNMTDFTDETMFKGVYHIPPGHYYKAAVNNIQFTKQGKIATTQWYLPTYSGYNGSFEQAAKTFETHFKNSVKEHLISDVPVGSALSGGLDSSAIVCEINNLLKEEGKADIQKTFSYCSSDSRYNEKKWIDEVTKVTKVDAHFVTLNGNEVFEKTEELIWFNDEPTQSQSVLASYQVYQSAKNNNVKALINGQGADEYLSGYGAFNIFRRVQLLKKLKFKKLHAEIKYATSSTNGSTIGAYFELFYFLAPNFIKRFCSNNTANHKQLVATISVSNLKAKNQHPYDSIPYESKSIFDIAYKQLLYDPLQKYLRFEDRMSMANSIEARVPFLDHRLVDFATQLPADYLDSKGELKKIMLHGLKNILPDAILNRKDKIGFITSEENWVRKEFSKEFRSMLQESINASSGIIKPEALAYFDKLVAGTIPFTYNYWRFIQFGLWMKKFKVSL